MRVRAGATSVELEKAPTGIRGLDEITNGGIPRGRPTLICGAAGCGKTLFGIEFLVRGAEEFGEPGVFVAFEEQPLELAQNVHSLGFDLRKLERQKKLFIEYVHVERSEIAETGEYDLEALFLRLGDAIDTVKAKRVVLDTLETLFAGIPNESILRAELRRLFRWLKDRGVTAIITAERGEGQLTRQGLEEYVSDCVILLDHRVYDQIATRRLRVVKYRGSSHGTNEYPFLIDESGIDVLPITSIDLNHPVSTERISTGVPDLDAMLGGGPYRGSAVLVSGTAGAGKSSVAAHMVRSTCARGERALFLAYEESPQQIARNMRSIGVDIGKYARSGELLCIAERPTSFGLEMHLAKINKAVREHRPSLVVIDPITNFFTIAPAGEVKTMLMRVLDILKAKQITAVFTSLTGGGKSLESTDTGVSSLIDTWIVLRDLESNGERNRTLSILKSRGTAHSNQVREFLLTRKGIQLIAPYLGPEGVLTGSARVAQEARERRGAAQRQREVAQHHVTIKRRREGIEAQIEALRADLEAADDQLRAVTGDAETQRAGETHMRDEMALRRTSGRQNGKAVRRS